MKRLLLFILLAAFTANSFAQNQRLTMGAGKMQNETVLVQQRSDETIIKFNLNEVELIEVDTDYGKAFIPMSDDAPLMLEKGSPELLYLTSTFIIPDTGDSELEIAYGDYQEFEHIEIAPSKGNLSRSIDPQTVPYVKGNIYQKDGFYPEVLANLREPFIMRDLRGQSVDVYPIQYNPVTKVLRIYSEITVKVKNISQTGISEFTGHKRHSSIDPEFDAIYGSLFINHTGVAQERGYPTGEEGEILIICHHAFMNAMKPYVDWKRTIGRKTTMVSTAVITPSLTAANIWTYIHNYYNNPANNLAYVLLVGDYAEILPRVYSSGQHSHSVVSNNYFGQLSGTNSSPSTYMDVLIGRMSAQAAAHVETQVQRTIWYERDLTTSDTWLSAAIGIATNEGGGGGHDGAELDYVHMNNIRTRLMTYGYTPVYQEYGAGSGVTTTTVANISARFNSGVGMANYCNHGSEIAWTLSSGYSSINYGVANVNALTNNGKLPYIFSVACLNGRFNHTSDCFAEAWMRRQYNDQPAGAVATLMASVSIAWAPPMTAQDEFVNICMDLASPYPGTQPGIKRTFAGAALNATQKMLLRHGTGALNLGDFNSWNVFGDPTLMIRTKTPQAMTVSYDPFISIGVNDFTVDCDTEGALVTMSYIDSSDEVIILGTGTVVGGTVNLTLNETIASNGTITIAVVARDRVTYVGEILAASPCERPVNLSADTEINTVILNWDNSDSMDGVLLGYDIYCNGSKINTSLITAQEYRDENLTNGTYTYQVVSVYDDGCQSPPSTSITMVIELYAVNYQSPQNGSLSVMAGTATIANGSLVNVGSL
ncbi:MAG: C25 family cysteine peptidase, partial [Bacteroidales bacterium]|nr:C25 family cysteine peptidase [Bacteroidales bacterium]